MLEPDEICVDVFVRVPPRSGILEPVVRFAAGRVDSPVEYHLHPPVGPVRQLAGDLVLEDRDNTEVRSVETSHLELLLSGVEIHSSVIPAGPDGVVDAEEDDHVFAGEDH